MNENQTKIGSCVTNIFGIIGKQANNINTFQNELARIVPLPYVDEIKTEMRNKAQAALDQESQAAYKRIQQQLDLIRNTTVEMENEFEIAPDLQAAINLVSAVGKGLPFETRLNLVKSFVGHKQALVALQSLFASNGIDESEVKKYIFEAEGWCSRLDDSAFAITVNPGKNIIPLVSFGKLLSEFAELEGAEMSADISTYVDMDEYYGGLSRAAMGLPQN